MKKTLFAVAALACAAGAQAQSSVTLYGVLDQSVGYTSKVSGVNENQGRQVALYPAGGLEGSRWGLRGSEDLGAGLSAFFNVESGINLANGKFAEDGTIFNRKALVGLRSRDFGSVSFGRQSDMVVDFVAPFSQVARYARTMGGARYDLNNFDYSNQLQNSIKYVSPSFSGFYFGGAVSIHGVAGANRENLVWSAGAGYDNGPFKFGLAYTDSKNANFNPLLTSYRRLGNEAAQGLATKLGASDIGNVQSRYRVGAVGGSYTFGPASIAATYSNVRTKLGTFDNSHDRKMHIAEISGTYQVTSAVGLGLGYTFTRGDENNTGDSRQKIQFHQVTAGANYALSRRSEVYITVAAQRNAKDGGTFINGVGPTDNKTQISGRVGLRHAF